MGESCGWSWVRELLGACWCCRRGALEAMCGRRGACVRLMIHLPFLATMSLLDKVKSAPIFVLLSAAL